MLCARENEGYATLTSPEAAEGRRSISGTTAEPLRLAELELPGLRSLSLSLSLFRSMGEEVDDFREDLEAEFLDLSFG